MHYLTTNFEIVSAVLDLVYEHNANALHDKTNEVLTDFNIAEDKLLSGVLLCDEVALGSTRQLFDLENEIDGSVLHIHYN